MGIQYSPFTSVNWLCKAFVGLNLGIIPDVMAYFPLTPQIFHHIFCCFLIKHCFLFGNSKQYMVYKTCRHHSMDTR